MSLTDLLLAVDFLLTKLTGLWAFFFTADSGGLPSFLLLPLGIIS